MRSIAVYQQGSKTGIEARQTTLNKNIVEQCWKGDTRIVESMNLHFSQHNLPLLEVGYLHEECPLGKLFLPSITASIAPVHAGAKPSYTSLPSGKHLAIKSGLGLPTISLIPLVMQPFSKSDMVRPSRALRVSRKRFMKIPQATISTEGTSTTTH